MVINARTVRCTHRSFVNPVKPDSSPNQHASRHAGASGHPIVRSMEPGEDWMWCYVDEVYIQPA